MPDMSDEEFIKSLGRTPYSAVKDKPEPKPEEPPIDIPKGYEALAGGAQTFLGIPESIAAGGRWMASRFDPDVMTVDSPFNRALALGDRFRRGAESSNVGMGTEIGTSFLSGLGEEAAIARFLGSAPTTLMGLTGRAIRGGISGATSQPSESPNEFIARTGLGALSAGFKGKTGMMKAAEEGRVAGLQAAARTTSADEQMARAAMAGVKKKDPMYQQLASDYGDAREAARQARNAIPSNAPPGFWPFLHNLNHYWKMNLARWLMTATPPRGAGEVGGYVAKKIENPQ